MKRRYSKTEKSGTNHVLYAVLIIASVALLFFANRFATKDKDFLSGETRYCIARVDMIISVDIEDFDYGGGAVGETTTTTFYASVTRGDNKGDTVTATQDVDTHSYGTRTLVKEGDKVFLQGAGSRYVMTGFYRSNVLIIFACVFGVLLIVFGALRGVASLISLAFSVVSVFAFLVPAVLSGHNVYACAIAVCLFNVTVTPLLIGGFTNKAAAAILGCVGGVGTAAGIALALDRLLRLTGVTDEEMMYISFLDVGKQLDLNGIIFATVLIGALGAVIDVSMSISSPVTELNEQKQMSFKQLLSSAFNIGRDIMGAQTSTLVLAYIGCALPTVLVLVYYQNSFAELFNLEMVVVDAMEAIVGAFAILFTIPATALTTSLFCTSKKREKPEFRIGD